ncbi:hypothetical protein S245_061629, partial [Arachis hypogaea]
RVQTQQWLVTATASFSPEFLLCSLTQDVMLCGGSDVAIIPIGLGGFVACKSLSQRNTDPTKALRPWDINRDGFVMGKDLEFYFWKTWSMQ